MSNTKIRPGTREDTEWLYALFRETNRDYIESTWGWNELLQREAFFTNLPGNQFQVLESDGKPVGGFHLEQRGDHYWLEMLLVKPDFQRQGLGTLMMGAIRERARSASLPLRLSVLRSNPARLFYLAAGFNPLAENQHSVKMEWCDRE